MVWQKATDLAVVIDQLAGQLPSCESYRLAAQMSRAAASVPANIAEGTVRATRRDYANFLAIAKGSLMEIETIVMLAVRLQYLSQEEAAGTLVLITEVTNMLTALRSRLLSSVS